MNIGTKILIGALIGMNVLTCYYIILVAKETYDKWKKTGKWI